MAASKKAALIGYPERLRAQPRHSSLRPRLFRRHELLPERRESKAQLPAEVQAAVPLGTYREKTRRLKKGKPDVAFSARS